MSVGLSNIHGYGLFATRDRNKGEFIGPVFIQSFDESFDKSFNKSFDKSFGKSFGIQTTIHTRLGFTEYINHCEKSANLVMKKIDKIYCNGGGQYYINCGNEILPILVKNSSTIITWGIFTTKKIKQGEEFLINYNKTPSFVKNAEKYYKKC